MNDTIENFQWCHKNIAESLGRAKRLQWFITHYIVLLNALLICLNRIPEFRMLMMKPGTGYNLGGVTVFFGALYILFVIGCYHLMENHFFIADCRRKMRDCQGRFPDNVCSLMGFPPPPKTVSAFRDFFSSTIPFVVLLIAASFCTMWVHFTYTVELVNYLSLLIIYLLVGYVFFRYQYALFVGQIEDEEPDDIEASE